MSILRKEKDKRDNNIDMQTHQLKAPFSSTYFNPTIDQCLLQNR